MSRTQPARPCGLRLSLHSPQPTRPSSVSMRTNVHGRQPPSQCNASTFAIFMRAPPLSDQPPSSARYGAPGKTILVERDRIAA